MSREWINEKFLPVLISVFLTGMMTMIITLGITSINEKKEIDFIVYETYVDLINLRYKVSEFNNEVDIADEFITLNLMNSELSSQDRLKLLKILDSDEVNKVLGLYTQGKALDRIMELHIESLMNENEVLKVSTKSMYIKAMKNPILINKTEEWDEILKKMSDYLRIEEMAEVEENS